MTSFWKTQYNNVDELQVLSDKSIVVCGTICSNTTNLTRYGRENGDKLYTTDLELWAGGMTEVALDDQQYLAVSFKEFQDNQDKHSVRAYFLNFFLFISVSVSCSLSVLLLRILREISVTMFEGICNQLMLREISVTMFEGICNQ